MLQEASFHTLRINRSMVDGVIESPNGAHFTLCTPDYERDEKFQAAYVKAASDATEWEAFQNQFLSGTEADYQNAVAQWRKEIAS